MSQETSETQERSGLYDFVQARSKVHSKKIELGPNALAKFNVGGKTFLVSRETLLASTMYSTTNRPRSIPSGLALEGGDQSFMSSLDNMRSALTIPSHNFFTKLIEDGGNNDFVLKDENGSYFIDRSSQYFEIILDFLRTGELNIPRQSETLSLMSALNQPQPSNTQLVNIPSLIHHDMQVFAQKLIKEADFYMIDISDQLYNIVGDGVYVSEDLKGGSRRSLFFFDKDPIYKPCSLFMNGLFLNNLVCDKEIIVKNGCIEVYNENAQLHFAIYPTTVHGDENHVNEFVQMQPQNIHQNRRSGESDNALIVRDLTRFGTSFILREVKAPMQLMINMNGKNYFNLSDYNHSIKFTRVDTFHIKVTEKYVRTGSSGPTPQSNPNYVPTLPINTTQTVKPTTPTEFDQNVFNDDSEPFILNFEHGSISPTEHRLSRPRSISKSMMMGSSSINISQQGDDNVMIAETVFRVLKTNFLAKNKREFMYIESRNRVYWLTKKNLLVFELSNKNL